MSGAKEVSASNRLLLRNSVLNLAGLLAPMVVAFLAIPVLIRGLGTERYGVLVYAWALVGYFSLLDLGLGQTLTQVVAERLGSDRDEEIPSVAWTALLLVAALGTLGGTALAAAAPWLVTHALRIPPALQRETVGALYLLALSLPFVLSMAGLRGVLEANQKFAIVNAIRIPMGALTFLAPVAVLPFSPRLGYVIGALTLSRILGWAIHLGLCLREVPVLRRRVVFDRAVIVGLIRFGGWVTASNVASTLLLYLDRFVIGAMLSMVAVAHYVTPYEAVTKLWVVPGALIGVLFPAFASTYATNRVRSADLFDRAVRSIFLLLFPAAFVLAMLARPVLRLWLGLEFAQHSTAVMQWMLLGVFINSLGMVPAAGLQAVGRPDLTGKLNLIELPIYLGTLWWLLSVAGIEGAAIAWVLRALADTVVLFLLAQRVFPIGAYFRERLGALLIPGAVLIGLARLPRGPEATAVLLVAVLGAFALLAWQWLLTDRERRFLREWLARTEAVLPRS